MKDFDPHITIEDQTDAKDVNCDVKDIIIDTHQMKIKTPIKVLSGKNISDKTADKFITPGSTPIFELTKSYDIGHQYKTLIKTLQFGSKSADWTDSLTKSFGLRKKLEEKFSKNIVLSSVFQYYPLNDLKLRYIPYEYERMHLDLYQTYLDYIYGASSAFILTPDVNLSSQNKRQISIKEYIRFIKQSVESLERHNNKPIFVPLQIDFADQDLRKVLSYYKKYGYTNIWINFKAKKCSGSNAGKLYLMTRLINEYLGKNVIIYCSQIKRERDEKKDSIPAFDMLPPFVNADFVGINKTRPLGGGDFDLIFQRKGFPSKEEYQKARNLCNCSLFNPDTYMYCSPPTYPSLQEESITSIEISNVETVDFLNGIRIDQELARIKSQIHEEKEILSYLRKKEGVKNTNIFENAVRTKSTSETQLDLSDFF